MIENGQLEQFLLIKILDKLVEWHINFDGNNNPYKNLILINSDNPQIAMNRVINCNKDVYNFFSNLTTIQKAALMPKLEIFFKENEKFKQIQFRNFPNFNEFSSFATDITKEFFFKGKERTDGAGIKKITINDRNENPGSVNIDCTIELFFDSILALTNSSLLHLIQTPDPCASKSEKDFRLKLVCGWNTPSDFGREIFSPEELVIIEKSNTVYLLSLVKHDLVFNQNGSISLTINYQGATEKYLASSSEMDIFGMATQEQTYKFLMDSAKDDSGHLKEYVVANIEKLRYESLIDVLAKSKLTPTELNNIANLGEAEPPAGENKSSEANKKVDEKIAEYQEKLDEALKKISDVELFVIKDKYARFIRALNNNGRLFYLKMDATKYADLQANLQTNNKDFWDKNLEETVGTITLQNFNSAISGGNNTAELALSQQKEKMDEILSKIDGSNSLWLAIALSGITPAVVLNPDNINNPENVIRDTRIAAQNAVDLTDISPDTFNEGETWAVVEKDKIITYTTLGDIINIAREFVSIPESENVEILVGPCNIGNLSINITRFPIAISTFMIWFVNTVVRQSVRKYQFWTFIYDLINSLITPFLRSEGLIQKDTVNINLAKSVVISDQKLEKGKTYLDTKILNFLSRNIFDTENIYSYLALYIYDYELDKRDGILAEDTADGIFHYNMAKDRGIIKSFGFSKIDFPRLRDMRITSEGFNNAGDLLREHYNMSLKTIGSPLFCVGSQLYFDGAYLGESGRDITERLGLGGYYLITKIETIIAQDLYEMNVECMWTSMRKTAAELYKNVDAKKEEP